MAGFQKKLCAIDFNFLLLLEAGKVECVTAFEILDRHKFHFILTESPLQELHDMSTRTSADDLATFAASVLGRIRTSYGIETPGLKAIYRDCAQITSDFLLERVLPEGASKNTALSVVEASLHECTCLVTLDRILCKTDNSKLNAALVSRDCSPIWIFNPELAPLEKL